MGDLGEGLKKIILAGIGTAAATAEKSKELLDEMVKKGELTVEQGKVFNQELKHNIKKTVKENLNVSVKVSSPEELGELLGKMTPEQIDQLKAKLREMEAAKEAEAAETVKEAEEAEEGADQSPADAGAKENTAEGEDLAVKEKADE